MLQKPADYDNAQSYDSDFERLPAGGYVCEIKSMEETVTSKTGTPMVVVSFDIAEGDYKDYYMRQYKRDKSHEMTSGRKAKWRGTYNVFPYNSDGMTNPSFKGLLVCIEKSNYKFKLDWPLNLDTFKGKKVGLLFREEEYEDYYGSIRTSVKACAARTADCIQNGEFNPPAKRTLNKTSDNGVSNHSGQIQAYHGESQMAGATYTANAFQQVDDLDDDLPF